MSGAEALGWIGALAFLVTYVMTSAGRLHVQSRTYQWVNIAAAALFVVASGSRQAWPSVALNVVWIGVGAVALLRLRAASERPAHSLDAWDCATSADASPPTSTRSTTSGSRTVTATSI
jgi:hypothetical protein